MQKVSTKKMSHKDAKEYREQVQDDLMYQHKNGAIYLLNTKEDNDYWGREDKPRLYSMDTNILQIG